MAKSWGGPFLGWFFPERADREAHASVPPTAAIRVERLNFFKSSLIFIAFPSRLYTYIGKCRLFQPRYAMIKSSQRRPKFGPIRATTLSIFCSLLLEKLVVVGSGRERLVVSYQLDTNLSNDNMSNFHFWGDIEFNGLYGLPLRPGARIFKIF